MKKISQTLKNERLARHLTLEEVEKSTKIKLVYLRAIEAGNFTRLPSKSYALGFVKNYAKFLDIPEEITVPLFRREYELGQREEFMPRFRKTQDKIGKRRIFNLRFAVAAGVIVVIVGFMIFQFSSFFLGPKLEIAKPQEGQEIVGNVIQLEGYTDPSSTVTVNDEEAYVGLDGKFQKTIYEFEGKRKITITSKNRFDNSTTKEVNIVVKREE